MLGLLLLLGAIGFLLSPLGRYLLIMLSVFLSGTTVGIVVLILLLGALK